MYKNKPPKWIQNPNWIIKNDIPLLFLEQRKIEDKTLHDNGYEYIFIDTKTNVIETIIQTY